MRNEYERKLIEFMNHHGIDGEHLSFPHSCHTVADAAKVANAGADDFVKNVCMIDAEGHLIVAAVKGTDRAGTSRVAKALGIERPRPATPEEILEKTGYPCGGTPSFGYAAIFLIDPKVMEISTVFTGGGSENSLVRISPEALLQANGGRVVRVRK